MASLYVNIFLVCGIIMALLAWRAASLESGTTHRRLPVAGFCTFQMTYLSVYFIAVAADWLHGPYVYALYAAYGYSHYDIGVLYVAGIGSSMILGVFIGVAADRFGRKRMCLVYCIVYMAMCITKHSANYWVLMLGRLLGGIATSLLQTCFESWLVCEHQARGYEEYLLAQTFSRMFYGSSFSAILAGVVAEGASSLVPLTPFGQTTSWHYGGFTAAFDVAAGILAVAIVIISCRWTENFGSQEDAGLPGDPAASQPPYADGKVWLLGIIISLFEGGMYIFVFDWTPAITTSEKPYGLIFSIFMVSAMAGSSLFNLLSRLQVNTSGLLSGTFALASATLLVPWLTTSPPFVISAFALFEGCVGVYWPAIAVVRSAVVPERNRAFVYNLFRVPLNLLVLCVLLNDIAPSTAFLLCAILMSCTAAAQIVLGISMGARCQTDSVLL